MLLITTYIFSPKVFTWTHILQIYVYSNNFKYISPCRPLTSGWICHPSVFTVVFIAGHDSTSHTTSGSINFDRLLFPSSSQATKSIPWSSSPQCLSNCPLPLLPTFLPLVEDSYLYLDKTVFIPSRSMDSPLVHPQHSLEILQRTHHLSLCLFLSPTDFILTTEHN